MCEASPEERFSLFSTSTPRSNSTSASWKLRKKRRIAGNEIASSGRHDQFAFRPKAFSKRDFALLYADVRYLGSCDTFKTANRKNHSAREEQDDDRIAAHRLNSEVC